MPEFTLAALKTEIQTDPNGYGYAGMGTAHTLIAEALNLIRDSGPAPSQITIDISFLESYQLQNQVVATEYASLTDLQRQLWAAILIGGRIEVRNANIRGQILAIWGAGTTTRGNLGGLQSRKGSRAEELWGDGFRVTIEQIGEALKT